MLTDRKTLMDRARHAMPGGVNSPVRAFRSVGSEPIFAQSARGAMLTTTDGNALIDYCMSFGPLILGHAHPDVVQAVTEAAMRGTSYAVTTEAEIEMAELIHAAIPSMERVRLVSSGTEACMTAIRVARGATNRVKILKFGGCYHGHADCLLVKAGSGVAGIATASSAGVPAVCANQTLVARYNQREDVEKLVREHGHELAAILVEPVAANMGLVLPDHDFLQFLREQADACGALLIFDGVICGFRFCFGEYQNICGVRPDLTCLGKIIGGGMPIGALGGRADLMEHLAPLGNVYQGGTLSGNPVSVAAGLATLKRLQADQPYADLEKKTQRLVHAIHQLAAARDIPLQLPTLGSVYAIVFTDQPIRSFEAVETTRQDRFNHLFHALLERGIYLPPSPFEVCFLSTAHTDTQLDHTLVAWEAALDTMKDIE
jgi:glutamate-1-semialdehyde 2,1-aminomutase